jgi:hypothetical protein
MAAARAAIIKINRCAHPVQPRKRIGMHALFFHFPRSNCRSQAGERAKAKASGKIYRPRCAPPQNIFIHAERSARLSENDATRIRESKKQMQAEHYVYSVVF